MQTNEKTPLEKGWIDYCRVNNKSVNDTREALLWGYQIGRYGKFNETSSDKELVEELRKRGYDVKCTKTQVIEL